MCTKKLELKVKDMLEMKLINDAKMIKGLILMARVQGTKPDYEDAFRCFIEIYDEANKLLQTLKYNEK
jgi:hypothetical protein